MNKLLVDRNLSACFEVDSAGTSSFHIGEPADSRMRSAAARRGIELTSRARMIHRRDFAEFDMVIVMDSKNLRELQSYPEAASGTVVLLSDFLDQSWPREVPDPYYGGDEGFEMVLDMLAAACPRILEQWQASPDPT
jgi:protein-tyrosine phosphatase